MNDAVVYLLVLLLGLHVGSLVMLFSILVMAFLYGPESEKGSKSSKKTSALYHQRARLN